MTVDNLLAVDIVLANGELVRASADENSDLFWALRGGGGNFGAVTAFEYGLHAIGPAIIGGMVVHPYPAARDVLMFYRTLLKTAPDPLTAAAAILTGPDGHKACAIACAYAGSVDEGQKAVRMIKEFGSPVMDGIGLIPYVGQFTSANCAAWARPEKVLATTAAPRTSGASAGAPSARLVALACTAAPSARSTTSGSSSARSAPKSPPREAARNASTPSCWRVRSASGTGEAPSPDGVRGSRAASPQRRIVQRWERCDGCKADDVTDGGRISRLSNQAERGLHSEFLLQPVRLARA